MQPTQKQIADALRTFVPLELVIALLSPQHWRDGIRRRPSLEAARFVHDHRNIPLAGRKLRWISKTNLACANCHAIAHHLALIKPTPGALARERHLQPQFQFVVTIQNNLYPLTIDHITPLGLGGEDVPENRQVLCKVCNQVKGCTLQSVPFATYK